MAAPSNAQPDLGPDAAPTVDASARADDRPLRVLRVIPHLASGGTERQCLDVLCELERSYDARELVVDLAIIGEKRLQTIGVPSQLRIWPCYGGLGVRGLWRSARALRDLSDGYDCVHAMLWPSAYAVALAGVSSERTVISLHSSVLVRPWWRRSIDPYVFGRAHAVAFNSQVGRARLAPQLGITPHRTTVVPNGKAAYDGPWPRRHGVLCPTRCMDQKRPDLLIAALSELDDSVRPSVDFVGTGTDAPRFVSQLEAWSPRVRGLGVVEDARSRMARAAIVASPSDSEGSPNVVLEAWTTRSCVLASRVPGVRELVHHGKDGWLVDNTPRAWAHGLARLLEDAPLRERLAAAGQRRVVAEFSPRVSMQGWVDLYAAVAERRAPLPRGGSR